MSPAKLSLTDIIPGWSYLAESNDIASDQEEAALIS